MNRSPFGLGFTTFRMYQLIVSVIFSSMITAPARANHLTLAAENDWAPYSSADKMTGELVGLTPALVRAAFATENINIHFKKMPFSRCMRSATTDIVLGCFNAAETADNKQNYFWHTTPLFQDKLIVFSLKKEMIPPPAIMELRGKRVGITLGYTYPDIFSKDKSILQYKARSDYQLINMLIRGRVDYILMNERPALVRIKEKGVANIIHNVGSLSNDDFKIAFSRHHPQGQEMAQRFERGLRTIKQNGVYDDIMHTFLDDPSRGQALRLEQ
ncbi:substrate-binding periplasmic protein [Aeromonas cavernicola]|uniref:Transporter n=1 Tax=Aeromonas cavernicola TaxID=1006623 RepID=A0A2H9U8W8_9GAMM|nr:transporter substrate-binding domain-containing protein [Aeromonas cavernicola]PJG60448.1 transporter [Aeromonas cavernicola]